MPTWYVNITTAYDDGGVHAGAYTDPKTFAEFNTGGFISNGDTVYIYGYRLLDAVLSNYTPSPSTLTPTGIVFYGWDGITPSGIEPWILDVTNFDHVPAWSTTYNHLVTNDPIVTGSNITFNACYFVSTGLFGTDLAVFNVPAIDTIYPMVFNGCTFKTLPGGTVSFNGTVVNAVYYAIGAQQRHIITNCVFDCSNIGSSSTSITMTDCRITPASMYTSVTAVYTYGSTIYYNTLTGVSYNTILSATLPDTLASDITKANMAFAQYGLPTESAIPAYGLWGDVRTGMGAFYFGSLGPTADFSGTPLSGDADLTVTFTDSSTGATGWDWDFGDGESSTDQNPVHIYTLAGVHTVVLTVTDGVNFDTKTRTDYVTVNMIANFTANKTSTVTGNAVAFSDLTLGDPDTWQWNFDDGYYSIEQNPEHSFVLDGQYTITLEASNSEDSDTVVKTQYITIENAVSIIHTIDEAIPPSEEELRNMPSTGTGSENLILKGIRYSIPGSEQNPEGSGFKRGNGPSLRFD